MAPKIIELAQNRQIKQYGDFIKQTANTDSFDQFLANNRISEGNIRANARIIRMINQIPDPVALFQVLDGASHIKITKYGKHLNVIDSNQRNTIFSPKRLYY